MIPGVLRTLLGLSARPLREIEKRPTHSLPAGSPEAIGEVDTHENNESRETVICAKKGVREEITFPGRDPRKRCCSSVSASSLWNIWAA